MGTIVPKPTLSIDVGLNRATNNISIWNVVQTILS